MVMSAQEMSIGCPSCDSTVNAAAPAEANIDETILEDTDRLQGTETNCHNCGQELEVYYY